MDLRLATPDDAAAVRAIYAPVVADTAISFEEEPPSVDELRGRIESTLERLPWLVCELDGAVAGYAAAHPHRERAAYRWSVETSVYVAEADRRRGVARGLYEALFGVLAAQGYVNAYAGTTLPNPASEALHAAVGFEPVGTYAGVGYKDGAWRDVRWWYRELRERPEEPADPAPVDAVIGTDAYQDALATGEARLDV